MSPEADVFYTPEAVSENGWLPASPAALRRAVERKQIEHTRFQGRIYFTRANILAIQAAGYQPAGADEPTHPAVAHLGRRVPATEAQPGVTVLRPLAEARRGGRGKARAINGTVS